MKLSFNYHQFFKLKFVLALFAIFQICIVQAQPAITICSGETAVLNSTIIPPPPISGAPGSDGQSPCLPGGGAPGPQGCSHTCQYFIEKTLSPEDDLIYRNGDSFFVAPLITTAYLISSRYVGVPAPIGGVPKTNNCQTGQWATEKFVVLVEDCSNICPTNNNLGNETLNGIATHNSELLTSFHGIINNDADIELKSGERVKLEDGFKIIQGAKLQVRIEPCN